MAAGQDRQQRVLDHLFLTEDHLGDFGANGGDVGKGHFRGGDDGFLIEDGIGGIHQAHVALHHPNWRHPNWLASRTCWHLETGWLFQAGLIDIPAANRCVAASGLSDQTYSPKYG